MWKAPYSSIDAPEAGIEFKPRHMMLWDWQEVDALRPTFSDTVFFDVFLKTKMHSPRKKRVKYPNEIRPLKKCMPALEVSPLEVRKSKRFFHGSSPDAAETLFKKPHIQIEKHSRCHDLNPPSYNYQGQHKRTQEDIRSNAPENDTLQNLQFYCPGRSERVQAKSRNKMPKTDVPLLHLKYTDYLHRKVNPEWIRFNMEKQMINEKITSERERFTPNL